MPFKFVSFFLTHGIIFFTPFCNFSRYDSIQITYLCDTLSYGFCFCFSLIDKHGWVHKLRIPSSLISHTIKSDDKKAKSHNSVTRWGGNVIQFNQMRRQSHTIQLDEAAKLHNSVRWWEGKVTQFNHIMRRQYHNSVRWEGKLTQFSQMMRRQNYTIQLDDRKAKSPNSVS